jgi:PAS domain S-box-containing protein
VHPDDLPVLEVSIRRALADALTQLHVHTRLVKGDGSAQGMSFTTWLERKRSDGQEWTLQVAPLPPGDISSGLLQGLLDASQHPVFLLDLERRILAANRTAQRYTMTLRQRPVRIGERLDELSQPEELEPLRRNHARAVQGERVAVDRTVRYSSDVSLHYHVRYEPVRDPEGRVLAVILSAEDRTADEETAKRRRLYAAALDQSTDGVTLADVTAHDLPLVYVNDGFERLTGYSRGELMGRNCRVLQGPETDRASVAGIRAALRAGRPHRTEILNYRKDGEPFWNELSLFPVRGPGGAITHYIGLQRDVTERRQLRRRLQEAERMETLGLLAGGTAHDFNNLLAAIRVNAELLRVDPENTRALDVLMDTVDRGTELTRSLLAFARAQPSAPRVLDVGARIRQLQPVLDGLVGPRCTLTLELPTGALPVRIDAAQLDQVVTNLVVNAREAHSTEVVIRARSQPAETSRWAEGAVELRVIDDGEGMSEAIRRRAFEPLFTTRPEGRGSGLGLATAYGVVHRHGGEIELESAPGRGTTARVSLPRVDGACEDTTTPGAPTPTASPPGHVLLVEDRVAVREATAELLEHHGHRVLRAGSVEEAVELAQAASLLELVVTNAALPDGRADEIAGRVRARHPHAQVLLLTGFAPPEDVGPDAEVLLKPFHGAELLDRVSRLLARARADQGD